MSRIEFPAKIRRIVAERSGYRCSFPGCSHLTVGPGPGGSEVSKTGIAAHILSAALGGPRGRGELSAAELSSPGNAIWLCSNHAFLVDTNRGTLYPEALLRSWKSLHETRIAREHRGISSPLGWFHSMRVNTGPLFATPVELILGKVSIIIGKNSIGKTALWEWLAGISDESYLNRWRKHLAPNPLLDVEVAYFDPLERRIRFSISDEGQIDYRIAGKPVPFQPHTVKFIQPKSLSSKLALSVEGLPA